MSSISTIALSGMSAATRRLDVSASNIANANSTGAFPNADGTLPAGARGARPGTNIAITQAPNDPAAHSQNAITNPRSAGSPRGPEMCCATIVAQI